MEDEIIAQYLFETRVLPNVWQAVAKQEDYIDEQELSSYKRWGGILNKEPPSDDWDDEEMEQACIDRLIEAIKEDGVVQYFPINEDENIEELIQDKTIKYLEGKLNGI